VVITNIRPNDEEPGLRDYEASFLRLLDKLCDGADISIDETGTTLRYTPGQMIGGSGLAHNCPPSRNITYFLEGLLLIAPLAKQPVSIRLRGVTNGGPDPSCDTFRTATLPLLSKFGLSEELVFKIVKRGALPLGGGEVVLNCPNVKVIQPVELLDEGKVKRVRGVAFTARVSPQFAARMVDTARGVLNDFLPDVWIYSDPAKGATSGDSPGYGLSLVAETITRSLKSADACAKIDVEASGRGGLEDDMSTPEAVGTAAAKRLLAEIDLDGVVDTTHQAIVLYFLSLAEEIKPARVRLSKLSPSAAQMLRHIKDFLGVAFQVREDHGDRGTVVLSCLGAGIKNTSRRTF
jgi:RNA 3'-terminal phosphate cyclase-like protein